MSTADLTRLVNDITIRVPGVIAAVVQQEMFYVVDEFLKRTDLWQEDISVSIVANVTSYDLIPADTGIINRLMQVIDPNLPNAPRPADMQVPGTLVLRFTPTQVATWTATVAKTVIDPTTRAGYPDFPEWILQKYRMDLEDGVLYRLFSQAAKPYSNQTLSVLHYRRWQAAIANARAEARRFNLFGGQRWYFPRFTGGRTQRKSGLFPPQ